MPKTKNGGWILDGGIKPVVYKQPKQKEKPLKKLNRKGGKTKWNQ